MHLVVRRLIINFQPLFIKFSERRTKFKDFDTKKDGIGRGILSESNCCTLVEIRI